MSKILKARIEGALSSKYRIFHFFSFIVNGLQKCISKSLDPNPPLAADFSQCSVATCEVAAAIAELSSLRSLTSPEGLTGPMALRNPACPCGTRKRALTRIAPLSPLKGAYPLQTTPYVSEFLRNSETYN